MPTLEEYFSSGDRGSGSKVEKLLADGGLVELDGGLPTRYNKVGDTGSLIDRILTN